MEAVATLKADTDMESLHGDLWLTRLYDILLPLSDLIHLPMKKHHPLFLSLGCDAISNELVTTGQAVLQSALKTHSCIYGM